MRKGQISVFLLLGIVIIILFSIVMLLKTNDYPEISVTDLQASYELFVENCMIRSVDSSNDKLLSSLGYAPVIVDASVLPVQKINRLLLEDEYESTLKSEIGNCLGENNDYRNSVISISLEDDKIDYSVSASFYNRQLYTVDKRIISDNKLTVLYYDADIITDNYIISLLEYDYYFNTQACEMIVSLGGEPPMYALDFTKYLDEDIIVDFQEKSIILKKPGSFVYRIIPLIRESACDNQ